MEDSRAETIEEHFDRCLELVELYRPYAFEKAKQLLGEEPLLSFLEGVCGKYDLDELAIEYDLDDRAMLTSYLSGLHDQTVGVIEWVLLVGAELMQNGVRDG
jgi:hypothetical protein